MNKSNVTTEAIQWVVLIVVFFISALFYSQISDNIGRFLILLLLGVFYVGWGCWHHGYKERLTGEVFFEYTIVAVIAVLLAALGLGIFRFI